MDQFFRGTDRTNRRLCTFYDLGNNPPPSVALIKASCSPFRYCFCDQTGRGKDLEEPEHRITEDLHYLFQFGGRALENAVDMVLQ